MCPHFARLRSVCCSSVMTALLRAGHLQRRHLMTADTRGRSRAKLPRGVGWLKATCRYTSMRVHLAAQVLHPSRAGSHDEILSDNASRRSVQAAADTNELGSLNAALPVCLKVHLRRLSDIGDLGAKMYREAVCVR